MSEQFEIKRYVPAAIAGLLGALVCNVFLIAIVLALAANGNVREFVKDSVSDFVEDDAVVVDSTGEATDVVNVVERANPAVVSIVATKDVPKIEQYYEQSPWGLFSFPQYRENGTEEQEVGSGSGFLVSDDGYIVTNAHVVTDDEAEYTVFLNDQTEYAADVVAADDVNDIAVLKIDGSGLEYLEFGDSDALKVGQSVIAIGNALGEFSNTVSVGIVSGLSRSIVASSGGSSEQLADVIQTDAAINPGNSGGPLLDLAGNVVGVNVATSMRGENISFSLPSNLVKQTVDSIRENGRVVRAYLGVRYQIVTEDLQEANNLPVDYGAIILKGENRQLAVVPGSPADKAGLEENDIILEVDGVKIDEERTLQSLIAAKAVGDIVRLKVLHDGDEKEIDVTLEEAPQQN